MFKRSVLIVFVILAGFLFLAALPGSDVQASPASPVPFTVTQPDGTTFTAIQWGDEYLNGLETVDGYSIAQIAATGYWYYLTATLEGNLAPAQSTYGLMIVGRDSPAGLKKHLRPVESTASLSISVSEEVTPPFAPTATGTHKVVVLLAGFPNATGRTTPVIGRT